MASVIFLQQIYSNGGNNYCHAFSHFNSISFLFFIIIFYAIMIYVDLKGVV